MIINNSKWEQMVLPLFETFDMFQIRSPCLHTMPAWK